MEKQIQSTVQKLKRRYYASIYLYVFLAVFLFLLSASIIFFNLFAVRMNPAFLAEDQSGYSALQVEQNIFIAIAILTAVSGFLASVIALFNFDQKVKTLREKEVQIKAEIKKFESGQGGYAGLKSQSVLLDNVSNILTGLKSNK